MSSPVYGTIVYGSGYTLGVSFDLSDVIVLNERHVRVQFSEPILVNSALLSTSSYVFTDHEDNAVGSYVTKVLPTLDAAHSVTEVLLETTVMPSGDLLKLAVSGVKNRSGQTVSASLEFYSRFTKTDSLLNSLPNHFESGMTSVVGIISAAVSTEDDYIGGQRSFDAPFHSLDYLITDLGARIHDEDGDALLS